jgi:hypothetical protein
MSVKDAAPVRSNLSLQTIAGALGAVAGIVTTIFGAGIYYESLTVKMNDYINKIETNEKALQALSADLAAAKGSIATLTSFNASLVRGQGDKATPNGTLCPGGSYLEGIHALSSSGGEHGIIYAITLECRKFVAAP